jgi:hypothetical protein
MEGTEQPSDDMARLKTTQFLDRKRPVHQAAVAEVAVAERDVRAAEANRLRAHEALTVVDDGVRREGYITRMRALDAQLLEYLNLTAVADKRQRRAPLYIGSHELRHALSRLAIENPVTADQMNPLSPRNYFRRAG